MTWVEEVSSSRKALPPAISAFCLLRTNILTGIPPTSWFHLSSWCNATHIHPEPQSQPRGQYLHLHPDTFGMLHDEEILFSKSLKTIGVMQEEEGSICLLNWALTL